MRYEIYLDSYFWLNAALNGLTLYLTGKLLHYRTRPVRLAAAAVSDALLACAVVLLPAPGILKLSFFSFVCDLLTLHIAFSIPRKKYLFYAALFYYGAGFLLSGALLLVCQMLRLATGRVFSPLFLLAAAGLFSAAIAFFLKNFRRAREQGGCVVTLTENGRSFQVYALVDTGNGLVEPFTGKPVCVVEKECLEQVADEAYRRQHPEKSRVIPFHSVGRAHGMMQGFCLQEIIIDTGEQRMTRRPVTVAVSEQKIAGCGAFQMLLPPELIKEDDS